MVGFAFTTPSQSPYFELPMRPLWGGATINGQKWTPGGGVMYQNGGSCIHQPITISIFRIAGLPGCGPSFCAALIVMPKYATACYRNPPVSRKEASGQVPDVFLLTQSALRSALEWTPRRRVFLPDWFLGKTDPYNQNASLHLGPTTQSRIIYARLGPHPLIDL